jgi:undecaprenyl-diphosphatase
MHDLLNAVLLGIVEGLTEFIPVSSTGHLLVAERFLNLPGERWDAFTVVIQLGAILAVVAVYWRKFLGVLVGLPTSPDARRFAASVIVACIPAVVVGLFAAKYINAFLLDPARAAPFIAVSWIVGGILILLLERMAPQPRYLDGDRLPLMKAFQIGLCQVVSLIPGTSRSGSTILGGELLGVERKAATAFTFYLAIPIMVGATILELRHKASALTQADTLNIAVGFVVSFIVAYAVIRGFIAFVGRYGLKPFGWYRIAAGFALIAALALGW